MWQDAKSGGYFMDNMQAWLNNVPGFLDLVCKRPAQELPAGKGNNPYAPRVAHLQREDLEIAKRELDQELASDLERLANERKDRLTRLDWELAEAVEALHEDTGRKAQERIAAHREVIAALEAQANQQHLEESDAEGSGEGESEDEEDQSGGVFGRFMGLFGARPAEGHEPADTGAAQWSARSDRSRSSGCSGSDDEAIPAPRGESEGDLYLPSGETLAEALAARERQRAAAALAAPGSFDEDVLPRFDGLGSTAPGSRPQTPSSTSKLGEGATSRMAARSASSSSSTTASGSGARFESHRHGRNAGLPVERGDSWSLAPSLGSTGRPSLSGTSPEAGRWTPGSTKTTPYFCVDDPPQRSFEGAARERGPLLPLPPLR
eukprot:TRINITY_DN26424_c0_g3_i2.p1 TRINITY_DN26424_c0_g3~~TRINITY_DN26424_c0_g3_i2.p1  ORF type:complete len:378 (-),score=57.99 TRINITY_DN26424_c0_g3_i2:67-1200(-)